MTIEIIDNRLAYVIFLRWSEVRFINPGHSERTGSNTMLKIAAASSLPCSVICVTDKTQLRIGNLLHPNNGLAKRELIRPRQPRDMPDPKAKIVHVCSARAHFMHGAV
jgi:hypothetical protein